MDIYPRAARLRSWPGAATYLRCCARNNFLDFATDPEDLPGVARPSAAPDLLASHELHRRVGNPPITVWPLTAGPAINFLGADDKQFDWGVHDDFLLSVDASSTSIHSVGGGGEGGGLIERIQAMIFQRSSEVLIRVPMAGIGPFTVPSPKRW